MKNVKKKKGGLFLRKSPEATQQCSDLICTQNWHVKTCCGGFGIRTKDIGPYWC